MRELKFRAFRKSTSEMYLSPSEIQHIGSWFEAHLPGSLADLNDTVIMQYVGLKCRGNTQVYESDLLINPSGEVWLVVFYEGGFYLKCPRKSGQPFYVALTAGFLANKTQIGNIHQNPELLQGGEHG